MLSRLGLAIHITLREPLIGSSGGALALWAHVPWEFVLPVAFLVIFSVQVRWYRRSKV